MDRIDGLPCPRAASPRSLPNAASSLVWLALAMPGFARARTLLDDLRLPDTSTLLVLGVGGGVVLIAVAVLAFAIRQVRREAAERRRLYTRHRRVGGHGRVDPAAARRG